jgi:NDP-4-keto-2,6-dideoxyhexose 3-C-methyltransferase
MISENIVSCRICDGQKLTEIISLGRQKITSRFPVYNDLDTPDTEIDLVLCENCELVQLKQKIQQSELYEQNYGYKSGISNTMRTHLKEYNDEILSYISLNENDTILDIGSNDATMLKYYSDKYDRIGIDPTGKQFEKYYINIDNLSLISDYFSYNSFVKSQNNKKCKIVSSISMFYDLPDPVQFAKDIHSVLDDDGIWTCEQSYLLTMIKTNSLDTICHEHLEYYGLKQIQYIAELSNFKLIDVKLNSCNGGSFRIYFCKSSCMKYEINHTNINNLLENEEKAELGKVTTYQKFMNIVNNELNKLTGFIKHIHKNNETIQIYGASTKGNCILQYCDITEKDIKYAVERNPDKKGMATSTNIPIIMEEDMRSNPPNYLLVLPWHFKQEIIEREEHFLKNGGRLIFYFPTFEIISHQEKILITGCDGFLGNYMKEQLINNSQLYGITRNLKQTETGITKFEIDMNDYDKLKQTVEMINPSKIIHFAGVSSSIECFENPIKCVKDNSLITVNLCDIIHKQGSNIKLLNCSSSEVYKGHAKYMVTEDDKNYNHLHPYSICKVFSSTFVEFYRKTYNLSFSNITLFTTQSVNKNDNFLLNKINKHIKSKSKDALDIYPLNSYRNIIHPKDVCNGIMKILEQPNGDDYLICNESNVLIKDVVIKLFELHNINIIETDNKYIDPNTNQVYLQIKEPCNGLDTTTIDINGYPDKLKKLGWNINYDIDSILQEFVDNM